MTGQPGDVAINGWRADFEIPGNLAVGHTAGGLHEDPGIEVGPFLPVRLGESLCAEAAFAGFAGKPLDTGWGLESPEVADLLEGPGFVRCVVVYAVRVGAVGRDP